jgi:hypothetical protein
MLSLRPIFRKAQISGVLGESGAVTVLSTRAFILPRVEVSIQRPGFLVLTGVAK